MPEISATKGRAHWIARFGGKARGKRNPGRTGGVLLLYREEKREAIIQGYEVASGLGPGTKRGQRVTTKTNSLCSFPTLSFLSPRYVHRSHGAADQLANPSIYPRFVRRPTDVHMNTAFQKIKKEPRK